MTGAGVLGRQDAQQDQHTANGHSGRSRNPTSLREPESNGMSFAVRLEGGVHHRDAALVPPARRQREKRGQQEQGKSSSVAPHGPSMADRSATLPHPAPKTKP